MRQQSVAGAGHQSLGAAVVEGSTVEAAVTLLVAMPPLQQLRVAVAAIEGNWSPSPARSGSPIFGSWDEFPISELILTMYEPIQRVQWLPRAVADALEGEGPFRFLLRRVGARQGPWEVLARIITSQEGEEVRRRAEFFSGKKAFGKFFCLAPPFILRVQLKRQVGVFYVKVFDGSLCIKEWEESDDDMTPPPV